MVENPAATRISAGYGSDISEGELRLPLGALRLDRALRKVGGLSNPPSAGDL